MSNIVVAVRRGEVYNEKGSKVFYLVVERMGGIFEHCLTKSPDYEKPYYTIRGESSEEISEEALNKAIKRFVAKEAMPAK
ncbi:MAG: hypothetical protein V1819_02455 [bacterium]